ncbi:MAG: hypothetical protein IPM71_00920 [Bacteroidota bacterium]|nr:MAG: hypothetical protein IPM71_00920 [Bacteroidota bacterium]
MKLFILISILLVFSIRLEAQNAKKGFNSLEKLEFDKAYDSFQKNLAENKDHVASNFGMAMVLADERSPSFNIVDSWQYVINMKDRINVLSQEELEYLSEYFLATEERKTNRPVKKKIELAIEAVESRLIKYIREENNLEAVYSVLEKYPDFKYHGNVVHIRNQFEFRKYEKMHTLAGYEEFIQKFPDAAQVPKATRYRNQLAFDQTKSANTVQAYNQYIKAYPQSAYLQQAIKLRNEAAYAESRKLHTLAAYDNFIALYPDALQIPEAKQYQRELMYEQAKRIKTLEAYNRFISMYPDGAYYIDVFNLKASDLGQKLFQTSGFQADKLKWARAFDNNNQPDRAEAFALLPDGSYVLAGTTRSSDSAYTDVWIIKLDAAGKMLWNKTIDQGYHDAVQHLVVTDSNALIVIGKTQVSPELNDYAGWMFMMGPDGEKKWNKNLGPIEVPAVVLGANNKLLLSVQRTDTTVAFHNLNLFDLNGKKVADRDYSRPGTFKNISSLTSGDLMLSGEKWIIHCDNKLYIKWEDTLTTQSDFIAESSSNTATYLVSSDSVQSYFYRYSTAGKKEISLPLNLPADEQLGGLKALSSEQVLLHSKTSTDARILKLDKMGNQISETRIANGYCVKSIIETAGGEVSYLLQGPDILIITLTGAGF